MGAFGQKQQHASCNANTPCISSKDCKFDDWGDWSVCSSECTGMKRRTREILQHGRGDGAFCVGATRQAVPCTTGTLSCGTVKTQDCSLSDWSVWGSCDVECGIGQTIRSREVVTEPQGSGRGCHDNITETTSCTMEPCHGKCTVVHCQWGAWQDWSGCDKCGGERQRSRNISAYPKCGGKTCDPGAGAELGKCPRDCHQARYCAWAPWSAFGECSATCGMAVKSRSRILQSFNHAAELSETNASNSSDSHRTVAIAAKYSNIAHWFQSDEHRRMQEVIVSWVGGCFSVLMVMLAIRVRSGSSRASRGDYVEAPQAYPLYAHAQPLSERA